MKKQNLENISEARRYLDNAKEILREKARKEGINYLDKKYIRMAGNTAYNGVLEALDLLFKKTGKERKSVDWYKKELAKLDRKVLTSFNRVYTILHLYLGYDGEPSVSLAKEGIEEAENILDWVAERIGELA